MILPQSLGIKIPVNSKNHPSDLNYIPFRQRDTHFSTKSNPCIRNNIQLKQILHRQHKKINNRMKAKQKYITFYCDEKIKQMPQLQNISCKDENVIPKEQSNEEKKIRELLSKINNQITKQNNNDGIGEQQIIQSQKIIQNVQEKCDINQNNINNQLNNEYLQQVKNNNASQKLLFQEKYSQGTLQAQNQEKLEQQKNNEDENLFNNNNRQISQKTMIIHTQTASNKQSQKEEEGIFNNNITFSQNPQGRQVSNLMQQYIVKQNVKDQINLQKHKSEFSLNHKTMKNASKIYRALYCSVNRPKVMKQSHSSKLLMRFKKKNGQNE